ncbi:Uncharacterised protein [Yersinia enterocolitica]|uniref:Uncharacterized protein n=2 Tax=Yersinia enterocolitica TaxID=630 RepID=A0ABP1YGE9_YEREN|nr:Uncharacterised protein [Yersinia enterocolitica]CRX97472.1 Uncharacterised protein [Yersinia enterocolitica]
MSLLPSATDNNCMGVRDIAGPKMLGPHSHSKRNKVTHRLDPDKITVLTLLEIPLHAGKTSDSERAVLHRKTS